MSCIPRKRSVPWPPALIGRDFCVFRSCPDDCPVPRNFRSRKNQVHQLSRKTGNRIRYLKVDAETGNEVEKDDMINGYELNKGEYVRVESEELEAVALESARTIEIDEFVLRKEIDDLYLADPYYVAPDGEAGAQAFAVICEAIQKEGMVALGRVVFTSREHVIALEPRGKGVMGMTCDILTKFATKRTTSAIFQAKKLQRTCLNLPPTSSRQRPGTSILKNSKTTMKMR